MPGLSARSSYSRWRADLLWTVDRWQSLAQPWSKARDPHQLRLNSYRVLFTRGRGGVVLFVPQSRLWKQPTWRWLRQVVVF